MFLHVFRILFIDRVHACIIICLLIFANRGIISSKAMILAVMDAFFLAITWRSLKNSGLQRGLNSVTPRIIALLDFISAVPCMTYFIYHSVQRNNNNYKDLTISEAIPVKGDFNIQAALDQVNHWAFYNDMKLNPKKCKEMVLSFARSDVCNPDLTIDRVDLERVHSQKVLGLTLQNNLEVEYPCG